MLPPELEAHLGALLPAAAMRTFSIEKPTTFWINPLREGTREELAAFTREPVGWIDAYVVPPDMRRGLTETAAFREGRIYVQSLSSMLAPLALDPQPGEEVLDLAAAPGGKTLRIAALMQNRGRIAAVEPIKDRFFRLRANLERCGVTIARTYRKDGRTIGAKVPGRFDRVLLDAPCSSEARVSALDPSSYAHWSPRKIREAARKQRGLVLSAFDALKPGGALVYCTCSFAPEENEDVVLHLLERRPSAELSPLAVPIENVVPALARSTAELPYALRVLPTPTMDGFFLARVHKAE
jgi:NOL1/NOP2/sun family putative RNA methylase